jgi:GNAT superfamily N-acetyltransferase
MITRQPFDEAAFGRPFFRITAPDDPGWEEEWAKLLVAHPDAMADARCPVDARSTLDRLDRAGFRRICTQVAFERASDPAALALPVQERLALSDAEILEHARGFRFSRFRQDARVPPERADAWMAAWLRNSVSGRKRVVAHERGLATFATDPEAGTLVIDLVSVCGGGRGVGRRLMSGVLAVAAASGSSRVVVRTEAENVPAMRLYTGVGFRQVESVACLHRAP